MAPTINLAQATKEHVLAVNRDYVAQPRITYRYAYILGLGRNVSLTN